MTGKIVHLSESLHGSKNLMAYMVDRDQVYEKLAFFVVNARKRVDLMYCGDRPPTAYLRSESKESYVGELDKIIKAHGKTVRRIIRLTETNREWIKSVIKAHNGSDNFSLSLLIAPPELPLISAQVIDGECAIL